MWSRRKLCDADQAAPGACSSVNVLIRNIALSATAVLYTACSAGPGHFQSPAVQLESASQSTVVGFDSIQDQALEAVVASPTDFVVPNSLAGETWSRARLFFARYTTDYEASASVQGQSQAHDKVQLSNRRAVDDMFIYSVKKLSHPKGVRFIVECLPRDQRATKEAAQMNARNAARFIREGTLELSLLKR